MCEIITIFMAAIFSVLFIMQNKKGSASKSVKVTALVFWGAALMWLVDCVVSVIEGESFFDISIEDTILGFIIAASGLLIFTALKFKERSVRN